MWLHDIIITRSLLNNRLLELSPKGKTKKNKKQQQQQQQQQQQF